MVLGDEEMPKNLTLPTLDEVKKALHRMIDEHVTLREYKGAQFFGTPFEDGTGAQVELTVGTVTGMPRIQWSRLRPSVQVSMATKVEQINPDALTPEQRKAFAAKLLAGLK